METHIKSSTYNLIDNVALDPEDVNKTKSILKFHLAVNKFLTCCKNGKIDGLIVLDIRFEDLFPLLGLEKELKNKNLSSAELILNNNQIIYMRAFEYACSGGHKKIVKYLYRLISQRDLDKGELSFFEKSYLECCAKGNLKVIECLEKFLILKRGNLSELYLKGFFVSCENDRLNVVEHLYKKRQLTEKIAMNLLTCFYTAVKKNGLSVSKWLFDKVSHNMNTNEQFRIFMLNNLKLHGEKGHYDIYSWLSEKYITQFGITSELFESMYKTMFTAFQKSHLNIVKYIIEKLKLDVKIVDSLPEIWNSKKETFYNNLKQLNNIL